jgi:hypothetical protein
MALIYSRLCPNATILKDVLYGTDHTLLKPTLSIIGNVSKTTDILILNGENDTQTPVQQAVLLQQRLTEVKHPDHTLITYPNLGRPIEL